MQYLKIKKHILTNTFVFTFRRSLFYIFLKNIQKILNKLKSSFKSENKS